MNKKRLVLIRHNHVPADDRIAGWAYLNGFEIDVRYPFSGGGLDDLYTCSGLADDIAGTVIYGGPFNADDEQNHPFLLHEERWIEASLKAEIPLLGICQGAQQIARHLGAWTGPLENEYHEFGYYPLFPSEAGKAEGFLERPVVVAQAHFHTFDLPSGAVHLASSEAYDNQAYRIGANVYGFQFHAEQTIENFRRWQDLKWAVYDKPGAQSREQQNELMAERDEAQSKWFYGFLDGFFGPARTAHKKGGTVDRCRLNSF